MRTATAAVLIVVGLGAMTSAVIWARAQARADDVPVVLSSPAGHPPGPGWLHRQGTALGKSL
jgi:hypothetical protein